ncbi:MAG: hypothetical protein HND46_09950 [Chloroflexi bacterium]|nr:hypothetical protein [Chloroflexota bacterium]
MMKSKLQTQSDVLVRDIIYFDLEKTISIASQLEGGLRQEMQSIIESENRVETRFEVGVPKLVGSDAEKSKADRTSQSETKIAHHDLLVRVEEILFERGGALDLNTSIAQLGEDIEQVRSQLSQTMYVRVEGWALVQDYNQVKKLMKSLKPLQEFASRASLHQLAEMPEYKELLAQIENLKERLKHVKDAREKKQIRDGLHELEKTKQQLDDSTKQEWLPDWQIEGIETLIDSFMPNRIILRLFPLSKEPQFQIVANLKRGSFIDKDIDNFLFAYSSQPNVKLSVIGLITSIPDVEGHPFFPLQNDNRDASNPNDLLSIETAFDEVFNVLVNIEQIGRFSSYPNVTIYPLALYRTIQGKD